MTCASLCPFKRDQLREGAARLGKFHAKPTRASSSRPSPVSEIHFSRQIIMLQQLKLESSFVYNARIQIFFRLGEIFLFETWDDSQKWIEKFSKLRREIVNILTAAWPDGERNLADRFCVTSLGGGGCDRCNSISKSCTCSMCFYGKILVLGTIQKIPADTIDQSHEAQKHALCIWRHSPNTWRSSTEKSLERIEFTFTIGFLFSLTSTFQPRNAQRIWFETVIFYYRRQSSSLLLGLYVLISGRGILWATS